MGYNGISPGTYNILMVNEYDIKSYPSMSHLSWHKKITHMCMSSYLMVDSWKMIWNIYIYNVHIIYQYA